MNLPDETPARIVFADKTGILRWFNPRDAKGTWSDSRPLPTYLSWLPNGQWVRWYGRIPLADSSTPKDEAILQCYKISADWPHIEKVIKGELAPQIISESEAIQWLLALNHEPPDCPAMRALDIGSVDAEKPIEIYDEDIRGSRMFNPTGCVRHGPRSSEKYNGIDEYPEWSEEQNLFRHPSGHWTLISERYHCEGGHTGTYAKRLDDEKAAHWLFWGGFEVPAELQCLVKHLHYDPSVATPSVDTGIPESSVPIWQSDIGELHFRGELIRKVRLSATQVLKLLDSFHECHWERRIDTPFLDGQQTREAIKSVNKGLQKLRFKADGSGEGILWESVETLSEADESLDITPF